MCIKKYVLVNLSLDILELYQNNLDSKTGEFTGYDLV